jgi:hypothetical protein
MTRIRDYKRRKRCRCSLSCYKFLAFSTRQKHYRLADQKHMLPSDSGSSTGNRSLSISASPNGSAHNDTPRSNACGSRPNSVRDRSAERDATDGLFDKSSDSEGSSDADEFAFDLSDLDDEDHPLTLQEMYEELEDILGPGNEEELWKIRTFKLFHLYKLY